MAVHILNPDREQCDAVAGMADVILQLALHHGASSLEFRTSDAQLDIVLVIGDGRCPLPEAWAILREPLFNYYREMFSASSPLASGTCVVSVASSTVEFYGTFETETDLTIDVETPLPFEADLVPVIRRYIIRHAARGGIVGRAQFALERLRWRIQDWRKRSVHGVGENGQN